MPLYNYLCRCPIIFFCKVLNCIVGGRLTLRNRASRLCCDANFIMRMAQRQLRKIGVKLNLIEHRFFTSCIHKLP